MSRDNTYDPSPYGYFELHLVMTLCQFFGVNENGCAASKMSHLRRAALCRVSAQLITDEEDHV